jgi:hypothetical protein
MTRRKTAEQTQSNTPADEGIPTLTEQPPAANPAEEAAPSLGTDGNTPAMREPGDDSATELSAEQKKSSWAPRTTIAVPLTEEAKRDHTKGEVARYIDGYNAGVGVRIDSPDTEFRPSEEVKAPLKEEHPYRDSMRWNQKILHNNQKTFHKEVAGQRRDGSERSPVAERLDAEERFEEMVQRRRAENDKTGGGKTPF